MAQTITDYQGNPLDVGGSVSIQRQLTSGVPIAKINNTQLYAPEGGGGGLSPLHTYQKIKGTIIEGKYINTSGEEVESSNHKYAVYDVSEVEGLVTVTTYLAAEGKKTCFGFSNGALLFVGQSAPLPADGGNGGLFVDTFDVSTIDTVKVNARISGEINVYATPDVEAQDALASDFGYLGLIANADKKALFIGDSLVQGVGSMYNANAVKFAQEILRTDCFNLGIGGGRMAYSASRKKDFHNILDGVLDNNWTNVDEVIADVSGGAVSISRQQEYTRFKEYQSSLGLFNIDFIFIAYGFNDWNGNVALDNENDKLDRSTILGALRTGLNRIQTAIPRVKLYVATPSYAHFTSSGAVIDTDTTPNSNGVYLWQVGDEIEKVCKSYHVPCLHQYYKNNVNANTYTAYLDSGGIHREIFGYQVLGEQYAKFIMNN